MLFSSFNIKYLKYALFLLIFFWFPISFFVYLRIYELAVIYTFIVSTILFFASPYLSIFFYIYLLPMPSIISSEYNLLGYLGINEISQIFVLILFLRKKFDFSKRLKVHNYVIFIICIISIYYLYFYSKGILLGYNLGPDVESINYVFKLFIKQFLKYVPLILIISTLNVEKIKRYILPSITLSSFTILISMMLAENLILFGYDLIQTSYALSEIEGGVTRAVGFYRAGGDTNSVAGFFLVLIGFILSNYEYNRHSKITKYLLPLLVSSLGVLLTASRTGFIILILLFVYFWLRNFNNFRSHKLAFFVFMIAVFSSSIIFKIIDRFFTESAYRAFDTSTDARLGYYFIYIPYFIDNLYVLITGYLNNPIWYNRSPHNFFLLMTYNAGLIFPLFFLYYIYKCYQWIKMNIKGYNLMYLIMPYVLLISTINSEGSGIYLWILISLIPHEFNRSNKILN